MLKYVHPSEVKEQHAEMIRQFAKGTQADRTTLRDRKNMWTFFSDADRLEFEEYSYHWFRALKSAGKEEWRGYAERAVEENLTIAQIRRAIKKDKDPTQVLYKRVDGIGKAAQKVIEDEEVPEKIRESLSLIPSIIQDTKELIYEQETEEQARTQVVEERRPGGEGFLPVSTQPIRPGPLHS
jgi:hypothetical protein